jgi:hypothetical protein
MSGLADSELLTLDQAAERLRWEGGERRRCGGPTARARRLRATIEARECETGAEILHRRGVRLRVTMYALKEHFPEFFPGGRERLNAEGRFIRAIKAIRRAVDDRFDPLERWIARVEHDGIVTREMLATLAETVKESQVVSGPIGENEKKSESSSKHAGSSLRVVPKTVP